MHTLDRTVRAYLKVLSKICLLSRSVPTLPNTLVFAAPNFFIAPVQLTVLAKTLTH